MNDAIHLEAVTFAYPEASLPTLENVSLSVPEGTFALLVGHTGSGKSTLLRTMNGLVPHFSGGRFGGNVFVAGRSTVDNAPRKLADVVAFVPQDPAAAFVVDRVEDELAYAMENLAVPPAVMRRRIEEVLDLLDLAPLRARSVRSISGGERQRVAIAAALTAGPRILLLDEPTSQLDPQGAEDVLACLQRLVHDLAMTVVAAEHRLERIASFADAAIGCLGDGRVVYGEPREVMEQAATLPPVARLGQLLAWDPLPLNVRDARRAVEATSLRMAPRPRRFPTARGEVVAHADAIVAAYDRGPVLNGVSLELHRGELLALVGRNGAGKTTLLRSIAGLHPPSSGRIVVEGGPPLPGRNVGLCPQEPESVLFRDSVRDEVAATVEATDSGADIDELLGRLGLGRMAALHPRDLSAGQRLLVAVGAIVATGAEILLLDEPTRGLDRSSKDLLVSFLRSHATGGGAVVVATHDVELVGELATRVLMLADGDVISDGEAGDVIGESPVFAPQTARVFGKEWLSPEAVGEAVHDRAGVVR